MASPTSARDYYPAAPGGASEFTPENAMKLFDLAFSVGPNVLNQLNRIGSDDIPLWETGLNYGDVARNAGYEGLVADALGLVGDLVEPGPGEFASVAKWAPALAATIPRELLEAFGRVTRAGDDGLPRMVFHGTASPRPTEALRPSSFGAYGPGFYVTENAEKASGYANMGRMPDGSTSTMEAFGQEGFAPSVHSGYYGSGRTLDIDSTSTFSQEQSERILLSLQNDPEIQQRVNALAEQGNLSPKTYYDVLYNYAPSSRMPQLLGSGGFDGWYSKSLDEGVMLRPSTNLVEPWNVDRMVETLRNSEQISDAELDDIMRLVTEFKNPGGRVEAVIDEIDGDWFDEMMRNVEAFTPSNPTPTVTARPIGEGVLARGSDFADAVFGEQQAYDFLYTPQAKEFVSEQFRGLIPDGVNPDEVTNDVIEWALEYVSDTYNRNLDNNVMEISGSQILRALEHGLYRTLERLDY